MRLIVNGEPREIGGANTLTDYLSQINLPSKMVVVEHNGKIVPRERYAETLLSNGDTLEIVQMMAGG